MNAQARYGTVAVDFDTADRLKILAKIHEVPVTRLVKRLVMEEEQRTLDGDVTDPIIRFSVDYEDKQVVSYTKSGKKYVAALNRRTHEVMMLQGFLGMDAQEDEL